MYFQTHIRPHKINSEYNTVQYWGFFSQEELTANKGKLLMLDIDFGKDCSLKCPTCFRRKNVVDDSQEKELTFDELVESIAQAKELGLKTIKICGAGEPFENEQLLEFARLMTSWGIGLSIFTKGHILGSDELSKKVFGSYGVNNSYRLAEQFLQLKTSILLSYQSMKQEVQDRLVGNIKGYTLIRDRALNILMDVGFNSEIPTRLALCTNPITKENYNDIFYIYRFCREHNILPVIAALMISGKQFNKKYLQKIDVTDEEKIDLFVKVYQYNIEHGIHTVETLEKDGISPMPGIHPCNQIAAGMYLTLNGNVVGCPGNTQNIFGNIRRSSLKEIWEKSYNKKLSGSFNCKCPPKDGISLPKNIYEQVRKMLQ